MPSDGNLESLAAYSDALARDWMQFGVAQTGQLAKANARTVDSLGIIERCEARDAEAIANAGRRWWQIWK